MPAAAGAPRYAAGFNPPAAPFAPATTVVTATKTDSFADPDGDGKAEPGDTITYDVNVNNSGAVDATGVNFSDTIDPNTALVPGSLRVSPLAFAESYSAAFNTPLSVPAPGVLANDTGTPAPTAQPIASGATTQGGTVTLNADGSFNYTPPTGFQGADTFNYTATNGTTPNDTATVTINVDDGPVVTSTSPANGANGVAPNSNITVTFSEPVNATAASFSIECPAGSPQTFSLSASPAASFTLDPSADLPGGTTCTVKVFAGQITDADTFDPPDQMAADYTFSFGVKPLAVDDMRSATGNVRINTATTGYSVLANDNAPGATITAFDATSAQGGQVTMNTTTGTFTYDPPRGFTGTDSFNYTITNAGGSDTGTVVVGVTDLIWFIDNASSCSSNCDGRLTHPYTSLAAFEADNGSGGAGDPKAGDSIFVYTGGGNYTGPLTLEDDQVVVGQGASSGLAALTGITPAPDSDALPSTGGTAPVITTAVTTGAAVRLAQNDHLHGLAFSNTDAAAISGTSNVGALVMSEIAVNNSGNGAAGISLTGGGSVTSSGVNTIVTGTGTALNVVNTDIAATGLTFKSISAGTAAAGPASGIVLNNTGSLGGLTVTGDGDTTQGGNNSGGTIQKTTGAGISLTNTTSPSFTNVRVINTAGDGLLGTRVTNFTFKNGTIDTTGTAANQSNISFRGDATGANPNLSGTVTITGNVLGKAFYHGVDIQNYTGTISDVDISGNALTSSTASASSQGSAIRLIAFGTATSHAEVTKGNINNNVIQNFPAGDGIQVNTGNATVPAAAGTTMGQAGSATNIINITGNRIAGASAASKLGGNAIIFTARGTGQANANIDGNGTAANPITNVSGVGISFGGFGLMNMTGTINNNRLVGLGNVFGSQGISVGLDRHFAVTDNGTISVAVTNNTVSGQDGNGILVLARNSAATINATVKGNNVAAPASGVRQGIAVNSNNSSNGNTNVCLDILNNTSAGSGGATGIGLRKQGTNPAVNVFGIEGMAATATPGVEAYVNGQNPSGGGTTLISATSGFSNCSTAPNVASLGVSPQGSDIAQASVTGEAVAPATNTAAASEPRVWSDMPAVRETSAADAASNSGDGGAALSGARIVRSSYERPASRRARRSVGDAVKTAAGAGDKTEVNAARARALFSGETVNAGIGTLPAGKTVHITFQVTVDNPFPTGLSQVANQGTVSGDNFAAVSTDDPAAGGSADPTVTQILTPPAIAVKDASVAEPATGSAVAAFAVTLSHAYTHTVTVDFATANGGANPATAGSDYTPTSGTLTFNPGQTVQTVSVPVLADADATETDETFLVNLGNNSANSSIAGGQATGTITPEGTPGTVVISEVRTSGPGGADDDFVELYNNTDSPVTVNDASGGWALVKSGGTCGDTPVVIAVIPNGTVIPARGNYLLTGSAYSLGAYAAGDQALVFNVEDDHNVALFNTADLSNVSTVTRLDAVGFGSNAGGNCDLLREGSTLAPAGGSTAEYSFVRSVEKGATKDTNDNASDFVVVSTTGGAVGSNASSTLGAPGPENSTGARGPVPCDVPETAKFGRARLDSTVALGSAPNTVRDATAGPNAANGTIAFSRRFTNNTGGNVTRLRFRITNTLNPATTAGAADLRALSATTNVVSVNDPATCGSAPCNATVIGTTLEQPPAQTSGGGVNSTLGVGSISSATPLLPGASVNVRLLFGVQTAGSYHVSIVVETETAGQIGQDEWELRGKTEDGGASASDGGCNTPPVANAGADQTIECGGGTTAVTLDGTASTDADGDALAYEWREGATVLGTTATLNTSLSFGPHTVTLKVTDPSGDFSEDTVSVNVVDTTDPSITAPGNVSVSTGPGASSCGAFVSDATLGSATASDGCSASVTVTRTGVPSGNNFPVGTTIVTYTADDGHGHTAKAYQSVTVTDNTPPVITTPANINVNAPTGSCSVSLDPGTASATDNCAGVTVAGVRSDSQPLNAPYPVGTTTITWTATDAHGNTASGAQTVTVNDATPPVIVLTTNAISLGSPNHQYQTLSVSQLVASAGDSCDPSVDINDVVISQATSDEADDAAGAGDGNTVNDIVIAPDCKSLQLRAERQGGGDGRVYKVTLKVKDSSGNVATAVRTIVVPQSGPAVDSGVHYTVNGCNP